MINIFYNIKICFKFEFDSRAFLNFLSKQNFISKSFLQPIQTANYAVSLFIFPQQKTESRDCIYRTRFSDINDVTQLSHN